MKRQAKKTHLILLVIIVLFTAIATGIWIHYLKLGVECGRNERLIAMVIAWVTLVLCVNEISDQSSAESEAQTSRVFWKEVRAVLKFFGKLFLLFSAIGAIMMLVIWLTKPGEVALYVVMGLLLVLMIAAGVLPCTKKLDIYLTKFLRERGFLDWLFGDDE